MSKPMNIRLDLVHVDLLEAMIKKMESKGQSTNKTDLIQRAIYNFAREIVLTPEEVTEIIDKHYS